MAPMTETLISPPREPNEPLEPPIRPPRPVAAWLAIAGSAMLLVAAIVVVASQWNLIPQAIRFSGLLAAVVMIAALGEQIRGTAPTTAAVIAHLVPAIAVTVGIAAGSTLDLPWPTCIVIGGGLGAVVTEVQKRRWMAPRMAIIAGFALVLAMSGLADVFKFPAPILVAGLGLIALAARRTLESFVIASVAALSPVLATLTTVKYGEGTMRRIGAAGPVVAWSAPIAGVVVAIIFAIFAHRRRSSGLAFIAVGSLVVNVVAGMAVAAAPASIWVCLPALLIIVIEVVAATKTETIWRDLAAAGSHFLTIVFIAVALASAPYAIFATIVKAFDPSTWVVAAALTALACGIAGWRQIGKLARFADICLAAAAGSVVFDGLALGLAPLSVAIIAAALLAALLIGEVLVGRSLNLVFTARACAVYTAGMAMRALAPPNDLAGHFAAADITRLAVIVLSGLFLTLIVCRHGTANTLEIPFVIAITAGLTASAVPAGNVHSSYLAGTIVLALLGAVAMRLRPALTYPIVVLTVASATAQMSPDWQPVAALGISAGLTFIRRNHNQLRFAWSPQIVIAAFVAAAAIGASSAALASFMIVAAVGLTGISFVTPQLTAMDSAALSATTLATLTVLPTSVHPAIFSLLALLIGAQGVVYGLARRHRDLALVGAAFALIGSFSLWFTSGANRATLITLKRYDITGVDFSVVLVAALLVLTGVALRRWQGLSSWLAYGPGLALIASWTLVVQTQRHADWATMLGLAVAVLAMSVGGWRRLGAPLLIGTASLIATTGVASGSQLASLPGWSWMVVGGVALLTIAALIERHTDAEPAASLKSAISRFQ